ncbi:hypothetical protein NCAS_0B01950 [Naumovozyma castellii]|uniref:Tyrosine--tRNA ligase n=1 Tax=Naumovozyma castellii TaxID=27288 RepID=G0VBF3_NAUCA|nr:hypothetical protein NCAS_0B01950 [Naumovozyma castellii CBS 4309]CCC68279.1 hypothetical protein NCAS_0B01950 [Naumovozyma castellii CBS 4309]
MLKWGVARRWITSTACRSNILSELKQRGLVSQISQPESWLSSRLKEGKKIKLYCGVDPTAKSLHLGNLVPLMVLLNFYVRGHDIVTLVGGATGRVGDPSGRKSERSAMEDLVRETNVNSIGKQLQRFFLKGKEYYETKIRENESRRFGEHILEDNYHWWKDVKMLDFLAQYGRHIKIQSMLSRDSVAARLSNQNSMGFNEFTYQILQAFDFYHLYKEHGVMVQVGGNDQWGNITAGIDLIGRLEEKIKEKPAFGITVPLLTTSTGEKFGKSAGNAVFIDPEVNTPFDIYQFFYNTTDADVERFLNIFTLLTSSEITEIVKEHAKNTHLRSGQKILAREITELLHGKDSSKEAEQVSDILFASVRSGDLSLSGETLVNICSKANILQYGSKSETLIELIARLTNGSKSEAKRKIAQGSVYLHSDRIKAIDNVTNWEPYLIDKTVLLMKLGKQNTFVVKLQ